MPKFRKKPVEIEARQIKDGDSTRDIVRWILDNGGDVAHASCGGDSQSKVVIETLEGNMEATHGDWVICGVNGEFYPCKPDIFEQTYEEV